MLFYFSPHAAALYRVEPDWSVERVVRGVTQSNGIAWSPSGSRNYFIDSATQGVDVFDYDVGAGESATGDGELRSSARTGYPMG